jgi:hypothetical protein
LRLSGALAVKKLPQGSYLDPNKATRHLLVGLLTFSLGLLGAGGPCGADGLALRAFPREIVSLQDTVTISWEAPQTATLRYAPMPGNGFPENYPLTISRALVQEPGLIRFVPEDHMPSGIYHCLVSDGSRSSPEFVLAISSLAPDADNLRKSLHADTPLLGSPRDTMKFSHTTKMVSPLVVRNQTAAHQPSSTDDDSDQLNLEVGTYTIKTSNPSEMREVSVPNTPSGTTTGGQHLQPQDYLVNLKGLVHDASSQEPLDGVLLTLEDSLGHVLLDTSDSDGEYVLSARPGSYLLAVHRDGYETPVPWKITLFPCDLVLWDVALNQRVVLAPLSGTVIWGAEPISQVQVTAKRLSGNTKYSTWTNTEGAYQFDQLPAQDSYFVEAYLPEFEPLSSGPIWLSSRGHWCDFRFPRGQICWSISEENEIPLAGAQIHLTGSSVDITLDTDLQGTCQTPPHLPAADYRVSITGTLQHIPPAPYYLQLGRDEQRFEKLYLPIRHKPWPCERALPLGKEAPIGVEVSSPEEDTQIHLYYRRSEDANFVKVKMLPETKTPIPGRNQKTDGEPKLTVEPNSFSVPYWGEIPAQRQSGSLEYFIETRHRGHLYSHRSHPHKISLSKSDVVQRAQIVLDERQHQRGGPYLLLLRAFDEEGLDITNQLTEEDVAWTVLEGRGQIQWSPDNPTLATYESQEHGQARIGATATLNGIVVSAEARVTSQPAVLGLLEIMGPSPPEISNQSQAIFRFVALDTSGQSMTIKPGWHIQPQGAGALAYSREEDMVTFVPQDHFIGQVRISLTDSISGQAVEYNAGEPTAECDKGLAVYHLLTGGAPEAILEDGAGFRLRIPDSAFTPGDTAKISLRKPFVPDVKRYTTQHEIHGEVYELRSSSMLPFVRPVELVLPIVPESRSLATVIGQWNPLELEWVELGGVSSGSEIRSEVNHFSQFAVLGISEPLSVKDIQLLPNPFTPHDPYGLQLGFSLSTNQARKPFVTIKIYNMAGDLVRTICENEPMPKGNYLPGESFLDSRGRDITKWDGRTATGELARNGRYLIHFKADDSSGSVETMKTAVLIK